MLTCKQVVQISSSDQKTSFKEKLKLRIHLFLCHECRSYRRHLKALQKGVKSLFLAKMKPSHEDKKELTDLENQILKKLNIDGN